MRIETGVGGLEKPTWRELRKLRGVASYQFGRGFGDALFRGDIQVTHSRKTGRIRHIYRDGKLISTLRPRDGHLALSTYGARAILEAIKHPPSVVVVRDDVRDFIRAGRNAFAKHVIEADQRIRPMDEVIVVDQSRALLAVGRALLSGEEMKSFKRGVAVKVRRGTRD